MKILDIAAPYLLLLFGVALLFVAQPGVAADVGPSKCAPPPVTTAEQAICLATADVERNWRDVDLKDLRSEAFRHDERTWVVTFQNRTPMLGGGGGQVNIDVESGKVTGGSRDQ